MIKKILIISILCSLIGFSKDLFLTNNIIVFDNKTKIFWSKEISKKKLNWKEADRYCRRMKYKKIRRWSLPNIYELSSLIDYTKIYPSARTTYLDIKAETYWTSTIFKKNKAQTQAWNVDFKDGRNRFSYKRNLFYAICKSNG